MTEREHGTYPTYQWHIRRDEEPCDECRAANTAYSMNRWKTNPEARKAHQAEVAANTRALWRLAKMHPSEFRALCAEERQKGTP